MNKSLGQLLSLLDSVYRSPFELKLRARLYSQLGPELRIPLSTVFDNKLIKELYLDTDVHLQEDLKNETKTI